MKLKSTRGRHAAQVFAACTLSASCILGSPGTAGASEDRAKVKGIEINAERIAFDSDRSGTFQIYAGCLPEKADEVIGVCRDELAKVAASGVTAEELARAKGQIQGAMVLGSEGTNARMGRLLSHELTRPRHSSIDEDLVKYDAVTQEDVAGVAADLLARPRALAVIGPYEADRVF